MRVSSIKSIPDLELYKILVSTVHGTALTTTNSLLAVQDVYKMSIEAQPTTLVTINPKERN